MKKLFFSITMVLGTMFLMASYATAQVRTPSLSPAATLVQQVGLTDVKITYSRPGMRGRTIFGDLVPYGALWRTGANASTKISFSDDVTVEGHKLPAGEYALYSIPEKDEWTIILHKNTGYWGAGGEAYKQEEEAARFTVKTTHLANPVASFTIELADMTLNTANIQLMWENTAVKFKVEAEVESKVMADINRYINNMEANNAGIYHQAASYYYQTEKDLDQALEWANKAVEASSGAFYIIHLKANILAKQNNKKAAIAAAEESIKAAKAANNTDYIRLNEKLIAELKGKK